MNFCQSTHLLIFLFYFFWNFNVRHKDWLIFSGETNDLLNSVIIFVSQTILTKWLAFLLEPLAVILTAQIFWICVFLSTLVSALAFRLFWNSDHAFVSVSIDFFWNLKVVSTIFCHLYFSIATESSFLSKDGETF